MDYHAKFVEPKILYQVIQTHSSFALDDDGHYINDKVFTIPGGDLYLLGLLNSPLMWWIASRYFPHMINEAINPAGFLMEKLPIIDPPKLIRNKVEAHVRNLIELTKSFTRNRASFLQWVSHESGINKVPSLLESPWRLQAEEFLAELKKAGLKRATPDTLQHLMQTFEREASVLRANRVEALRLEHELDDLILKVYKLTPDEIALLRQTAPPRSPITVLEQQLQPSQAVM